jgi:MarR family transcriptional regulator, organic hydroperoxide resistance regulator
MEISSGILGIVYEMKKKCAHVDQRLMVELNLSQSEYLFFSSLDSCQVISSNELSKNMGLSASRVSRVVDKLVVNGYLDRNTDTSDRRAITLCLTPKGKEIKSMIDRERLKCEEQLLQVIPSDEVEKLRHIIGKIIEAI